jgi:hypothetical protein
MEGTAYSETDPRHHTVRIKQMLDDLIAHLEEDAAKVDKPAARVLFEASAEVLRGLHTAFEHYDQNPDPDTVSR